MGRFATATSHLSSNRGTVRPRMAGPFFSRIAETGLQGSENRDLSGSHGQRSGGGDVASTEGNRSRDVVDLSRGDRPLRSVPYGQATGAVLRHQSAQRLQRRPRRRRGFDPGCQPDPACDRNRSRPSPDSNRSGVGAVGGAFAWAWQAQVRGGGRGGQPLDTQAVSSDG